jgi:peptidoglycan L-alanyl-D-glutamate endopeptidase CwlK
MSRDLNLLHSLFRPKVDQFLAEVKEQHIDMIVTCTFRSGPEQNALYAQGRTLPGKIVTRARAGQSAHNFGMAIDVVPIVNGKPEWDGTDLVWQEIGTIGQSCGLEWYGAPHSKFFELPHFQLPNWETFK